MGTTEGVPVVSDSALPDVLLRAIEGMTQGVTVAENSPGRPLLYANSAFVRLCGYPLDEILGRNCSFLQGPDSSDTTIAKIRDAIDNGRDITVVITNYRRDNTTFWNEMSVSPVRGTSGEITHFVGTQVDVTGRIDHERELALVAQTDALTGLTNQRHVLSQLDELLPLADGENVAVVVADLIRFHHINEDFDFETGDRVLAGVADRLSSISSPGDIVGRLAADQFVIVRRGPAATCRASAEQLAEEINRALQASIRTPEIAIPVRVNCGIAIAPGDGDTARALVDVSRTRAGMAHPPSRRPRADVQP